MSEKFLSRASLVCGAVCMLCACTLVGCSRDSSSEASQPAPAPTHANDPQLKRELTDKIAEREVLTRAQHTIVEKMEAVVKRYNGDLKAAGQDPEMASLIQRAHDIETNLSSNRTKAAELIRARALKDAQQSKASKKEVK